MALPASDNFDRSDATPPGLGSNWNDPDSSFGISSNHTYAPNGW